MLDSLTGLVFLAVIAAPTIDLRLRPDSARSPEKTELRAPAVKPPAPESTEAMLEFPAKYEAYFKDSFGLRDRLLRWNSMIKVFVFGVSPSTEVYFGKQGWIFYRGGHSQEDHRGVNEFTEVELQRWGRALESKRALLESMDCRYLYVIAPDKETVYPELLPDYMRPLGRTRRVQFVEFMKKFAPKVEILDLSDALIAAKRDDAPDDWVYSKLGTHWNGRGSRTATRSVLQRLQQITGAFDPTAVDSLKPFESPDSQVDSWGTRMYLGDLLTQTIINYSVPLVRSKVRFDGKTRLGRVRKSEVDDPTRPRAILMHDSFGPHLEAALAEQCSYLESHGETEIDLAEIETAAPLVFVDMYVERTLNVLDPHRLIPVVRVTWEARFHTSSRKLIVLDKTRGDWGITGVGSTEVGPAVSIPRLRLPIKQNQPAGRLALPSLTPVAGEIPVLHITIDSPCATDLVLFYRPPGHANFEDQASYRSKLEPGSNDLFLPLDQAGTSGDLRLQPGESDGTYLLREFEIRSVPDTQ